MDGAVVAEVYDLCPFALQKAANNVDGGVVAIKERRRSNKANWFHGYP
jgi:hypothetical protein